MSAGLFFQTVVNNARQRAEAQRQQAQANNDKQAAIYHDVLMNPAASDEQRQFAADSLNKLYQIKPAESPFHKVLGLLNHVGGQLQGGGQPVTPSTPLNVPGSVHPDATDATPTAGAGLQPPPDASTAPKPSQPQSLPPLIASPTPGSPPSFDSGASSGAPSAPQAATSTPIAPTTTNLTGAGVDTLHPALGAFGKFKSAIGRGLSGLAGGVDSAVSSTLQPTNLPNLVPIDASEIPTTVPPALKFDTQNLISGADLPESAIDRFGNQVDKEKKYVAAPDPRGETVIGGRRVTIQPFNAKPSNARPVPLHPISITDAKAMAAAGHDFGKDVATGEPIDIANAKLTQQLVPVALPGGKIGYTVTSQNQTHFNVGNEVIAVPTLEQMNAGSAGVGLGVSRVPTSTERVIGVDENNQPVIAPMTSTPITTGINGKGLPPLSSTPSARSSGKPSTSAPSAPTPSKGTRTISGVIPTGQANALRNRNTALNGTTTALENAIRPDSTGKSYLDLFKPENEKEREKVANFIRLNDAIAEGDYSNRAGEGDFHSLLNFTAGTPAMVASAKNDSLTRAYDAIRSDPSAVRAVADYYNLIGQIGGMRKATGANASQWSFQNLKQEVPSPLLDSSYEGVQAKMRNIANEVNSNAQPNLKARPFDMNLLESQGQGKIKTAADYLKKIENGR